MIVSFSGIDGAGKTTQIKLLTKYCRKNGIGVKRIWCRVRRTPGILLIKKLAWRGMKTKEKKEQKNKILKNPRKVKLLYWISMAELCWYWGIYYRLMGLSQRYLILDRYLWDTYVDICCEFPGVDVERSILWKLVKAVAPKPDKSIIFVIPAETSLARDIEKNAANIDDIAVKRRRIDLYMDCMGRRCWTNVIDGTKSIEEVHGRVKEILGL